MLSVRKRKGESFNSLMYRFGKRSKHTGLFKQIKKQRYLTRKVSKTKIRRSALHREAQKAAYLKKRKLGIK